MSAPRINKTVTFNADDTEHMKALEWAAEKGFSNFVRDLLIKAWKESER